MATIKSVVSKALNIQSGEGIPVGLLLIHSFFMGISLSFYFVLASALFVKEFGIKFMPYAYIASGILGYVSGLAYAYFQRRLQLSKLFVGTLIFLLILVTGILIGFHTADTKTMIFILYSWVASMYALTSLEFWGLSVSLFNLRQGKRLFGLLGSGDVISSMIGYISVPILVPFLSNMTDLLYIALAGNLLSLLALVMIVRTFKEKLSARKTVSKSSAAHVPFSSLIRQRYFVLLFTLAVLSMVAVYFSDYSYLSLTRTRFETKEEISQFIGILFAIGKVIELVMSLVSGRLLNQYGIRLGLTLLPILMAAIIFLADIFGTAFGAASSSFFILIAFSKLIERSVRKSIDGASARILYQPLPPEQQLDVQAKVEGVVKHLAIVLAGILMLPFGYIQGLTMVHFSYLFLITLLIWVRASFLMYDHYRNAVQKTLASRHNSGKKRAQKSLLDIAREQIAEGGEKIALLSMKFLRKVSPFTFLQLAPAHGVLSQFFPARDSGGEELTQETLSALSRSAAQADREFAALTLAGESRIRSYSLVQTLLEDTSSAVRKAAILAAGKLKRSEMRSHLIELLSSPVYGNSAATSLIASGAGVLPDIELQFSRMGQDRRSLLKMVRIYKEVGGKKAIDLLRSKITHPDKEVRYAAITALAELEYKADESEFTAIKLAIEDEIGSIVWTMACLIDVRETSEAAELVKALNYETSVKRERIFLLLSLLYDADTINFVREIMQSGKSDARVFALEIIDLIVSQEIKQLLLPLLEDLSPEEILEAFGTLFPQEHLTLEERLKDVMNKDRTSVNRWTKSCAIEMVKLLRFDSLSETLVAHIINNDLLIAETSASALSALNPLRFRISLAKFRALQKEHLREVHTTIAQKKMLIMEKTRCLRESRYFAGIPDPILCGVALLAQKENFSATAEIRADSDNNDFLGLVLSGTVLSFHGLQHNDVFRAGEVFGTLTEGAESSVYRAEGDVEILRFSTAAFYEYIAEYPELARVFSEAVVRRTVVM